MFTHFTGPDTFKVTYWKVETESEDLTENGSGSKCGEFQDSSKLSSGLDRKCGSAKNNWLHEETHEEKEIWAALKLSTLATTSVLS